MAVFTDYGWCRIEGCAVTDVKVQYGMPPYTDYPFRYLPSSIRIFYGQPEVQIFNPDGDIQHVIYKVVPLTELNHGHASYYGTLTDIDNHYNDLVQDISDYDKLIVKDDTENSANYYFKPFVLTTSCVIFYDRDTSLKFSKHQLIIIDSILTPRVIAISGGYMGPPVQVGDQYVEENLRLTAVYDDGNTALLKQGYTVEPADKIVTKVGVNIFKITYITPPPRSETLTCSISITGIRKLQGIVAYYDGPKLAMGNKVERKYVIVVAQYTDGSSATVTDYTFPSGNVVSETNQGQFPIYYKGFDTILDVGIYDVSSARLTAYYNGPPVEIGYEFDIERCSVRISYKSEDGLNGGWENIDPTACVFSTTTIDHEGINNILVVFESRYGSVQCYMAVVGIRAERKLTYIEAEYTGPEIVQSDLSLDPPYLVTFSIERILCKAYYSDGSVETVKNFMIDQNYVTNVGNNAIRVVYRNQHDEEAETYINVIGLTKDDTMTDGSYELDLDNNYPEATRFNNRYRGPAESYKHDSFSKMLISNIKTLYSIFAGIEKDFNAVVTEMDGQSAIKLRTIHSVHEIDDNIKFWKNDSRFINGYYINPEDEVKS